MFRWCAYCFRFLGQRAPYDDYSATHGMCAACASRDDVDDADALARVRPLAALYEDLVETTTRELLADDAPEATDALLSRGRALGIRPVDLLVGVLQPALYEIGRRWASGRLHPTLEARFTAFCERTVDALVLDQRQRLPHLTGPVAFLLAAEANVHTLGIRMLAFALRETGRDVRLIQRPRDVDSICDLALLVRPEHIGISIALREQLSYAKRLAESLHARGLHVRIIVGGFGVWGIDAATLPSGLTLWAEAEDWWQTLANR